MLATAKVRVVFDNSSLARLEVKWAFDRLSSSSLLASAGIAPKGRYSPEEWCVGIE
jgi:ABC-type uncharacterized transport system substrate-binding protein